jgi:xylan 1,4-beta-xylosidase
VITSSTASAHAVTIACDLGGPATPLPHIWEHTVGSGHAPLALRADYQSQLRQCHEALGIQHVRFHGLLSDDLGTLVCEEGTLRYAFYNADAICDALLAMHVRPFVELSFMPTPLATGSRTVFSYAGNVTPPKSLSAWQTLIHRLVSHWVDRYGRSEVEQWLFEVWNEPNLQSFWTGTQAEYFALYQATATAIKRVADTLRVGGPATADDGWVKPFVDYCHAGEVPLDFVSTHHYPTDAFGRPGDDTEAQLAASHRSVLRDRARATHALVGDRPLFYTEWSTSSNSRDPLHDDPYAAAVVVKTMLEARGLVTGYSWWTFSDIFAENFFPEVAFHGGFGLLTIYGVEKPSYRAFELLHGVGTELLAAVEDQHPTVDAWAVRNAARDNATILITNHALPRHPINTEHVVVELTGGGMPRAVTIRRIDADHANPKARWKAMGCPAYLSHAQVDELRDFSRMSPRAHPWTSDNGTVTVELDIPPHAVAAVSIDGATATSDVPMPCP